MSLTPSTWTDPASIETQSGYFHWGTVWNTVYKEGCELVWNGGNWSSYSATSLVWPVRMKKSAGFYMGNTTAVAEFDSANGVVTGIAVTSPGWGYTTATAVKEGTLRLGASNVIAASRSVSVAEGATLDLNNKGDLTLDSISDCYGSVVNGGLVVTNELRFAAADLIAKKTERVGALTLGPDVKIVVDEPANLPIGRYKLLTADSLTVQGTLFRPAGFDEPWKVTVKKNSIYLSCPVGMMLLIR